MKLFGLILLHCRSYSNYGFHSFRMNKGSKEYISTPFYICSRVSIRLTHRLGLEVVLLPLLMTPPLPQHLSLLMLHQTCLLPHQWIAFLPLICTLNFAYCRTMLPCLFIFCAQTEIDRLLSLLPLPHLTLLSPLGLPLFLRLQVTPLSPLAMVILNGCFHVGKKNGCLLHPNGQSVYIDWFQLVDRFIDRKVY